MRLIVAGGRDFNDYELLEYNLTHILKNFSYDEITLICGEAKGADSLGKNFALKNGIKIESYFPDWNLHGKRAGTIRNKQMAENGTHLVAFWDGKSRGTNSMIELAEERKLEVIVIKY